MKKNWYRIENKTDAEATIFIYDEIGMWGITAKDFCADLSKVTAKNITAKINSPGGDVFDGFAMYNGLKNHPATIKVEIDGLAASIASVIALAGDNRTIAKNAFVMVHNAWSFSGGNASDMRKMADTLDKIDDQIVATYVDRTGGTDSDLRQLMNDETWLNAEQAIEAGFADSITDTVDAENKFDLTKFKNIPNAVMAMNIKNERPTERDIETILRDAGLSRSEAKAAVAATKKADQRDAEADEKIIAAMSKAATDYKLISAITR